MARKSTGLGDFGRLRARENLGKGLPSDTIAGHPLFDGEEDSPLPGVTTSWEYPDSSRVKAYQYDYTTGTLRVRFHNYNTPWVYEDVPTSVFQAFASSDSKGKYINSTLNYMAYRRATPEEVAQYFQDV